MGTPSAPPIRTTRRGLLAASGALAAGPLFLTACGSEEEERSPELDAEVLNAILAEHRTVRELAQDVSRSRPQPEVAATAERLARLRSESIELLEQAIADAGGDQTPQVEERATAESAVEALARQLERSIQAQTAVIRDLEPAELRGSVLSFVVQDAAALAHLRSVLGEEPAPDAFLFGPPAADEEGPEG